MFLINKRFNNCLNCSQIMLFKRILIKSNNILIKKYSTIKGLDTKFDKISDSKETNYTNFKSKTSRKTLNKMYIKNSEKSGKSDDISQISSESGKNPNKDNNIRFNQLDIQMISSSLKGKLFGKSDPYFDKQNIKEIIKQLRAHGLNGNKSKPNPLFNEIDIEKYLPKLLGNDLSEHFHRLGEIYSENYKQLVFNLIETQTPDPPKQWVLREGWTRYALDSKGNYLNERVDFPLENDLVFDVEVCMNDSNGQRPTLATAMSSKAWYSWCSQRLIDCRDQSKYSSLISVTSLNDMIPFGRAYEKERLIIGHNVSFDRSYIREQYDIKCDKTRFLDTLSLHMCVSGLTQHQRALSYSQRIKDRKIEEQNGDEDITEMWKNVGSMNNLVDVYHLYCDQNEVISKDPRNIFISGSISDVLDNFEELMTYCAKDVSITQKILKSIFNTFLERFPHPITFAGMLEMSVMYLPIITSNWNRYISECDSIYDIHERELNLSLRELANDACSLAVDKQYTQDVWLWDLDWETQQIRFKKPKPEKVPKKGLKRKVSETDHELDESKVTEMSENISKVMTTTTLLKKVQPLMAGYPKWFLEFCSKLRYDFSDDKDITEEDMEWEAGPYRISTQMRSVPKLMRLMWNSYPLHYDEKHGWGYLKPDPSITDTPDRVVGSVDDNMNTIYFPFKQLIQTIIQNNTNNRKTNSKQNSESNPTEIEEIEFNSYENTSKPFNDIIKGCLFYKLPHKDGPDKRVGNPLSKDFLKKIKDGSLTSFDSQLTDSAVYESKRLSYWKNASKRIRTQLAIRCEDGKSGAILPRVIVAGTVTRRAVEKTWLTASNAIADRIGSELKSMIQCPEGYNYVGADVDSQELWIASLIGDSQFSGIHGSTGMGWMTLQGDKDSGTDMHSKTAASINITRNEAKVLNYARIYGSAQQFASRFLMQSNPELSAIEAKEKAKKIFTETKGKRTTIPKISQKVLKSHLKDKQISESQNSFQSKSGYHWRQRLWTGGTESHMFNKLEEIANSEEPRTPVLECRISRALEPKVVKDHYMTSRVNWVVQSSAVDFLHIILISMKWLFQEMKIEGRFSISIHDEVRYLVKEDHKYKAALALQLSNLLTRSLFSQKLGIYDLPLSVAFFSRVDIDKCLRKEVYMDSKTPSNPLGLSVGYGIPVGESLNIIQLMNKLNKF